MKLLYRIILCLGIANSAIAVEIADLPQQNSIQALFAEVSAKPEHYLPHYTTNPPCANLMTEEANLVEVDNLDNHELAKMVSESYQGQSQKIKELPAYKKAENIEGLQEILSAKYADCQKMVQCAIPELEKSDDFKHTATELAVVSEASQQLPSLFQGQAYECRKYGFGFLNCCHESGWGQFVSTCNQHEIALMQAREQKRGVYLGTKKTGGTLKRKKYEVYCVFGSKLAKIVQEQGRFWQLGIGFGDAESPNCSGMSADELSKIDFDRIDFSEAYASIQPPTIDLHAMAEPLKNNLSEKMHEGN